MDDYHKRPSHHGLSDLLGDKMEEKEKRCKPCKRDGMPTDEIECARCEKTRKLYDIR